MERSPHEVSRQTNGVIMGSAFALLVVAIVAIFVFGSWFGVIALLAIVPLVVLSARQRVEGQDDPLV